MNDLIVANHAEKLILIARVAAVPFEKLTADPPIFKLLFMRFEKFTI